MIFASRQEIRAEVATRIRNLRSLTSKELSLELTRVRNLLENHIPMHLSMLSKHIAESHDRKKIEQQIKIFDLEVNYKLALMRYLDCLREYSENEAYAAR